MKKLLSAFLVFLCFGAKAANPAFSDFYTNHFETTGNKISIGSGAIITNISHRGSFSTTSLLSTVSVATVTLYLNLGGSNGVTDDGTQLLRNGVPIATAGNTTNYYNTIITTNLTVVNTLTASTINVTNITVQNNLTVSNLYTVNGNHNTLIVSNALTLQTIKTNVLATTSSGLITNANYGTGLSWDPTTLTLSASGSGSAGSTNYRSAVITLTMSGSNVTANSIDWNLTNQCYSLLLTNNAFFSDVVFTNTPNTSSFQWLNLYLIQDGTGSRTVTFTNSIFAGVNGTFAISTNANALDVLSCINSPVTNGNILILPANNLHR